MHVIELAKYVGKLTENDVGPFEPNHPWLSYLIAASLPLELDLKQRLLELLSEVERIHLLTDYLRQVTD